MYLTSSVRQVQDSIALFGPRTVTTQSRCNQTLDASSAQNVVYSFRCYVLHSAINSMHNGTGSCGIQHVPCGRLSTARAESGVVRGLPSRHVCTERCLRTSSTHPSLDRNATLSCDPDLFRMTGQVDQYYWSLDNVTTLCVRECLDDSSAWVTNVESACTGQTFNVAGKLVPVDSVAGRFNEGVVLACSTPELVPQTTCCKNDTRTLTSPNSDLPLNYTSNPDTNDESSVDDDLGNSNSTTPIDPATGDPIFDPHDIAPSTDGSDDPSGGTDPDYLARAQNQNWCFLMSQNIVGVDPSPDCATDPTNIYCTDPDSMNRLVSLSCVIPDELQS